MKKEIRKQFYITMAATLLCSMLSACSVNQLPFSLGHDAPPMGIDVENPLLSKTADDSDVDVSDNADDSANGSENAGKDNSEIGSENNGKDDKNAGGTEDAGNDSTADIDEDTTDAIESEKEVLLVYRRSNYAWGREDRGFIIDTDGYLYEYDFGKTAVSSPEAADADDPNSYEARAKYVIDNNEGIPFMNEETVEKIKELGKNVSADDEFEMISEMCDFGQQTVYYYDPDTKELLMCSSQGDCRYTPLNKSAEEISDIYYGIIDNYFDN